MKISHSIGLTATALVLVASVSTVHAGGFGTAAWKAVDEFNFFSAPPTWRQVPNELGGTSSYTYKFTDDPLYPNHRFENLTTKDASGNILLKETTILDSQGNIKAVK
ncbi:hypothetical protein [Phaeobacter inhibens]|uniref:hypothetical protein n=1 Tax=Phaeobacter inhibens TaxID=221822 RepID=UPI0024B65F42|nr:hypothetical protein [Phaeobacter inhibens]WHP69399.1 hypothetical protein QMZ01_04215 [Phaeobacter inhibens]